MAAAAGIRVAAEDLAAFVTAAFAAKGMARADAETVAEVLVWANLRGGNSHGVQRLTRYFEMIGTGEMKPAGRPQIAVDTGAAFLLEANRAAGPVAMMQAVREATTRATERGICLAIVRNASHAGAIGRYAQWAAERGFAAIVMAAGLPLMAYHGARTRSLSTNPIAMAVPAGRGPIALDMATSVAAAGRIVQARSRGETIPEGWALTEAGQPATDPREAAIMLPLGGAKGAGLALMIELFTGVLGGSPIMTEVLGPGGERRSKQNVFLLVINVDALRPADDFRRDADALAALVKALPLQEGFEEILLPGERGSRTAATRRATGIPLPASIWKALGVIAADCGVALPPTLAGS